MLKIAVCDDDRQILSKMQTYLNDFETAFIIDLFCSGEKLLASDHHYDL